jgi:alpha-tubulin suppressor-like RCC1 family protein
MNAWAAAAAVATLAGCHCGGSSSQALLTASPNALDFGTPPPLATVTKTLTLTNPGGHTVSVSGVSLSGANSTVFSLGALSSPTLDGGASEGLAVTFSPPAAGTFAAQLTIQSNAAGGALSVALSGSALGCGATCNQPPQCFSGGACVDGGCVYQPQAGGVCSDGEPCTTNDTCTAEGICVGTAVECNDAPSPVCLDGGFQRTYTANGTCAVGGCTYPSQDILCPAPGGCAPATGQCLCPGLLQPCATGCCPAVQVHRISSGGGHSCALGTDGGLFCWGDNGAGQLGAGLDGGHSPSPVAVAALAAAPLSVSAGGAQSCAVLSSGALFCWGNDAQGELGTGSAGSNATTPVLVNGLGSGVLLGLAGNNETACALEGSALLCWGDNSEGEVGDGTFVQRNAPVGVAGLDAGVVGVAADGFHGCALGASGNVSCWGSGADAGADWSVPVAVPGLASGALQVAVGGAHACALLADGTVACWGDNSKGQLGAGLDGGASLSPLAVAGLSEVSVLSAQSFNTCALTSAGAVWCWGDNTWGQLGIGTVGGIANVPGQILALPSTADLAVGARHACALDADNGLWCWGDNGLGQLGLADAGAPVAIPVHLSAF